MNLSRYLNISQNVQDAQRRGKYAVVIDSLSIVNSAPYPQNAEFAADIQKAVIKAGTVPAVTAIIDGVMRVGLSDKEIDAICKQQIGVATRQNLPYIIETRQTAATSVGGSMLIAVLAGIHVQASCFVDGVNANDTDIISADLQELRQSSVMVFACGISPQCSVSSTLHYLDTYSVPVIGVGTNKVPQSDIDLKQMLDNSSQAAQLTSLKWNLGLRGGVLAFTPEVKSVTGNVEPLTITMQNCVHMAAKAAGYIGT